MKLKQIAWLLLTGGLALGLSACGGLNVTIGGLTIGGSGETNATSARPTVAKVGALAPEINLQSLTGDQVVLSHLEGHRVIVNFWATWCGPCREEFPTLVRKYKQYQDQDVVILGVNSGDNNSDEGVRTFMRNTLVNFPIVRDPGDQLGRMYRINGLPTSIFIDRQGIIRNIVVGGPLTDEFIDQQLAKLN